MDSTPTEEQAKPAALRSGRSLSSKLLILTVIFVMIAEVLIFIPSIANFQMRWLQDRLNTVAVAAIVFANKDSNTIARSMQDDVLMATDSKAIVLRDGETSRLIAADDMPLHVDRQFDLSHSTAFSAIRDVFDTILHRGERTIRVFGTIGETGKSVEIVLSDRKLHDALYVYARNVFFLSLLISLITAALVFLSIGRILIRPIRAMTENMLRFSAQPESPSGIIRPDGRNDEIGVAFTELASMQGQLQRTLHAQKHLADLGLAVSKINHDMRNMLAPAQLLSDRLASVEDPAVQKIVPRLLKALDRAVTFSESVMAYGKVGEAQPVIRPFSAKQLIDEAYDLVAPLETRKEGIEVVNRIPADLIIEGDADQLFRVIANLVRNALQALRRMEADATTKRSIICTGGRVGSMVIIGVEDNGPGLPKVARDNLFTAFKGSANPGGTGLGLAIAKEIIALHGGTIELRDDRETGTHFEIRLPDQPVSLSDWQKRQPKSA